MEPFFAARHTGEFADAYACRTLITVTDVLQSSDHHNHHSFSHPDREFSESLLAEILDVDTEGSLIAICDYGNSRSTAIAILHAMKYGMDFPEAVRHVAWNHPDGRLFSPNLSVVKIGCGLLGVSVDLSALDICSSLFASENEILRTLRFL